MQKYFYQLNSYYMKQRLVLLPGVGSDPSLWQYQRRHLADIAEIVIPDLTGCNSRHEMVDAVLDNVRGSFALSGLSMGGWVGFAIAAQAPERITKFAPVGTWARPMPKTEKEQEELYKNVQAGHFQEFLVSYKEYTLQHAKSTNTEFIELLRSTTSSVREDVFLRQLRAYLDDFTSTRFLPEIRCPTLVICGRDDPIFSVEEHTYIAQHIPNARLAIIDDCSHFITLERPQAVSVLLRYWLMYF
jgi:pimeloyl-ACP methyl ester carboxylesterase